MNISDLKNYNIVSAPVSSAAPTNIKDVGSYSTVAPQPPIKPVSNPIGDVAEHLFVPGGPDAVHALETVGSALGGKSIGESLGTAAFNFGQILQGKNPFQNPTKIPGAQQPGPNPSSQMDIGNTLGGYANAASSVAPLTETAKVVGSAVGSLPKAVLLGKEGLSTLAKIANPEAKAFVPIAQGGLGKAFSSVVEGTQKAVQSFISKSKSALQVVKDAIPNNVMVPVEKVASTVNDAILKSVQSNADYHGVQGEVSQIFKTPESLINSGLLNTEEAAKVKGMVNVIKDWTDNSARGILNLKEQLAPFYKEGLNGSNHILSSIQGGLKNLVADVHPAIKPALETASNNIDKAEEFARHLLGTNPTTGESKLIQLAKNLSNPALKGYQHTLLDQLKTATGHDIMPQLKGYADYLQLLAKDFPSKAGTILKTIGKRAVVAGTTGVGIEGAKKLLGI